MDLDAVEVRPFDPQHFGGFVAGPRLAAYWTGAEADRELLPDLTVGVGHDVIGVAVDPDQAGDLDPDAGLLFGLPGRGLGHGLAELVSPAG